MKAYFRKELLDQELYPPYCRIGGDNFNIDWSLSYEFWQPDLLDNAEWNMFLIIPSRNNDSFQLIMVNSIDFDFEEENA